MKYKFDAKAILKSINRRCRKHISPGWDYTTWCVTYPQMASEFNKAAEAYTGRQSRFLPRFR